MVLRVMMHRRRTFMTRCRIACNVMMVAGHDCPGTGRRFAKQHGG
jgi:hypothetical protein